MKRNHAAVAVAAMMTAAVLTTPLFADDVKPMTRPAEAKKASNVVKTASGLEYEDLKVGEGPAAKTGDNVLMRYTGTFPDGRKFDSNVGGAPYPVLLGAGNVIKGWDEGIVGMKVGGKRKLTVPPDLGYGERGFPGAIPPNATLLFEVELVGIK